MSYKRRATREDLRRAWRGLGRDTDNPPRRYEARVKRRRRQRRHFTFPANQGRGPDRA